jgi:chromosome partitioning protein
VSSQAINRSIYNLLTDNAEKKCAITDCIMATASGIDIIPSNILLSTLEQELKDKEDAVSKLYHALSEANLTYDYALLDCPPNLGFLTFNALRACELVIVPVDMSAYSLMGVGMLLGMLELIKLKINHAPRVNALATLYDKRTKYCATMLEEIRTYFKGQALDTVIRMSVSLKKAIYKGLPVTQFDEKSNGAADHNALAKEILKRESDLEFEKAMAQAQQEAEKLKLAQTAANRIEGVFSVETAEPAKRDVASVTDEATVGREATFAINAPQAKEVYLVGDFNHWKINDESRLSKLDDGRWMKNLNLTSGRYRYKFIVDGEWLTDANNAEKEANPYGTFDSIIKL